MHPLILTTLEPGSLNEHQWFHTFHEDNHFHLHDVNCPVLRSLLGCCDP